MKGKEIFDYMMSFQPKFKGEKTVKQFKTLIRKVLKPFDVQFNILYSEEKFVLSMLTTGGFFDSDLNFGNKDIEMYVVVNYHERNSTFNLSNEDIHTLICELFKTLMHEMRHRYQYENREFDFSRQYRANVKDERLKSEMEYYGNSDELDAYAQECVLEYSLYGSSLIHAKYDELFSERDPKTYNKFLKKIYKTHAEFN